MGKSITVKIGDELKNFQGIELSRFLTPGGDSYADYINVNLLPNTYVFGFGELYSSSNKKVLNNLLGIIATSAYSHFNIFIRIENSFYPAGITGDNLIYALNEDATVLYSIKYVRAANTFEYLQKPTESNENITITLSDIKDEYTETELQEVRSVISRIANANNPVVMLKVGSYVVPVSYYTIEGVHYFLGLNPEILSRESEIVEVVYLIYDENNNVMYVNFHQNIADTGDSFESVDDIVGDYGIPTKNLVAKAIRSETETIKAQLPVYVTQSEYDALVQSGEYDPNTPYFIIEEDS